MNMQQLEKEARQKYPTMRNLAMARKLVAGEALDVRAIGHEVPPDDDLARQFLLTRFEDEVDYCDAKTEAWIWSIGKERATGRIFASTDSRYYQHPGYECLFLR